MSNKHVNHQHGLHTMNETRPKSKVTKKVNKANAKIRKAPLLEALMEARYGKKAATIKHPRVSKKTTAAKKVVKKTTAATKKTTAKSKKPASKKASV